MDEPAPPIDRWIAGLRVGLIAHVLLETSGPAGKPLRNRLQSALAEQLACLGAVEGPHVDSALKRLPTSTLSALTDPQLETRLGEAHGLRGEFARWATALEDISLSRKGGRPALVNASRLLAQLLLQGLSSPSAFVQCGQSVLAQNWQFARREDAWKESARAPLAMLRGPAISTTRLIDTQARIDALAEFRALIPASLPYWNLVENAVFHLLHAWPLVVPKQDTGSLAAFSIPVAVDIHFDGRNDVELAGGSVNLDIEPWRAELEHAASAAKDLWRSKHGGASQVFRETVATASVTFDFAVANKMLDDVPFSLAVSEGSMSAYMAQIVLSRLLGRSVGFSSAVTGEIGDRRIMPDGRPGLDFRFGEVRGTAAKLRYAFRSRGFTKIVLPDTSDERAGAEYLLAKTGSPIVEVNYCRYLSNVADCCQSNGWRQFSYIRAPDVAREAREHVVAPGSQAFTRVRDLLAENADAVVTMPESVNAADLVLYLKHVNDVERFTGDRGGTPPSLSWLFIRAVPEENDRRLWHTIWHAMGATREDFARFKHAGSPRDAATLLAAALNTHSPSEGRPGFRAPDLLVVLGSEHLDPDDWKAQALGYRTHIFPAIVGALRNDDLHGIPQLPLRRHVGKTRLIIVPHDSSVPAIPVQGASHLGDQDVVILDRLRTFRFGFTQAQGSVLLKALGYQGVDVRSTLQRLTEKGHLGECAGEYWVVGSLGAEVGTDVRGAFSASRAHWAAALAFAPYLSVAALPGLDIGQALLPQNVHEAGFHLEVAGQCAIEASALPKVDQTALREHREIIRVAHARLLRFIELPTMSVTNSLMRNRYGLSAKAAAEMARELIDEKRGLGLDPLPFELANQARAYAKWLASPQEAGTNSEREAVIVEAKELFMQALKAMADDPAAGAERLGVLTQYAVFLFSEDPRHHDLDRTRSEIAELAPSLTQAPTVDAQWFEIEGDLCKSPDDAVHHYGLSVAFSPRYFTCWVKFLGCRHEIARAGRSTEQTRALPESLAAELHSWAVRQRLPLTSGLARSWILPRWKAGIEEIASILEPA
ncbi:MAG: hypothetical protein WC729_20340 [Sphingomonas sp.]|jgi:hypothetical protein